MSNSRTNTSGSIDTFLIAEYTFDGMGGQCDAQGWTSVDRTAQTGVYFHIDDFAGLGGGDFGRLMPLEGSQSLWCGTRPDTLSNLLCVYATLPGYGNGWNQYFQSKPIPVSGDVTLSYLVRWDSEFYYDSTFVEYMDTGGTWVELTHYNGIGETTAARRFGWATTFYSMDRITRYGTSAGKGGDLRRCFYRQMLRRFRSLLG